MLCIIMVWPFAAAFAETAQETAGRENEGLCVFLLLEHSAIGYYLKVMSGNVAAQKRKMDLCKQEQRHDIRQEEIMNRITGRK